MTGASTPHCAVQRSWQALGSIARREQQTDGAAIIVRLHDIDLIGEAFGQDTVPYPHTTQAPGNRCVESQLKYQTLLLYGFEAESQRLSGCIQQSEAFRQVTIDGAGNPPGREVIGKDPQDERCGVPVGGKRQRRGARMNRMPPHKQRGERQQGYHGNR